MPTYTVTAPAGLLSRGTRETIARVVTRTHNEVTGARSFFAQVLFVDVAAGDWFMGGVPMTADQIFLHGQIRAGRTDDTKRRLIEGLRDALIAATGLPGTRVWCYIAELPSSQMVEYGHVLPQPGGEATWLASLPPDDRAMMEGVGGPT